MIHESSFGFCNPICSFPRKQEGGFISMRIKRICLYGIQGVYNYGCEAMVRSISTEIKEQYPDSIIVYESFDFDRDSEILSDCETVKIEKVQIKKSGILKKGLRFFKRKVNIARPEDYLSFDTQWTKECDALVIIGGDVFDLIPQKRKQRKYINDRLFVSKLVKSNGGKVFLWGISVGNFEQNITAKKTLIDFLKNIVDFGIIRDENSYRYLLSSGVENIALCSDPAFIQRTLQTTQTKKNILGINLSPLSNRYLNQEKTTEEWLEKWANVITYIIRELKYDSALLIPHVVNKDYMRDDDESYLKSLCRLLKQKNVEVAVIEGNRGFLGIKEYISKCDIILAARMHCAINAITCGVPVIFLAYSPKSYGMCKHIYGNEKFIIDMNELVRTIDIDRLIKASVASDELRSRLAKRNIQLMEDAKRAIGYIKI